MFLALKPNKIESRNVIINNRTNNNIIDNSYFYRIYYSDNEFISNGIVSYFTLNINNYEKYFNKLKINYSLSNNMENLKPIVDLEDKLLNYFKVNKKKKYSIKNQLKLENIKIINEEKLTKNINKAIVCGVKISGFWETKKEIGLTFRFIFSKKI